MRMKSLSSVVKKGGVVFLPLILYFSFASTQQNSAKPNFQIRKVATIQLDFGREKVSGPTDFRVGLSGDIYLLNYSSGKLFKMDSTGKLARSVVVAGTFYPTEVGFTISRDGDLFIADSKEKFIYRYDPGLDLIGKLRVTISDQFENIYDFLAASWGDLLLSCGKRSELWRLEPAGKSFTFEEVGSHEAQFYFSLSEIPGKKLVAYDNFNRGLVFLDRFGNRVKEVPSRPLIKLAGTDIGLICTSWSEDSLALLDFNGFAAASFTPKQLGLGFEKIKDFVTVGKKVYLLGDSLKIGVLELSETKPESSVPEKR